MSTIGQVRGSSCEPDFKAIPVDRPTGDTIRERYRKLQERRREAARESRKTRA